MQNACQLENKWPAAEDSYVFSPDLAWGRKQLDKNISCEQDVSASADPHGRSWEASGEMKRCGWESGDFTGRACP